MNKKPGDLAECPLHGMRVINSIEYFVPLHPDWDRKHETTLACGCKVRLLLDDPTEKPKLLFLDDRSKRMHAALRNFPDFEVRLVSNVLEALRALSSEDWEEVHLDHDLRGVDFEDPDSPECGMEVVRYLEKTGWPPDKRKPIFRIHSHNLFAAYLMTTRLQKLGMAAYYQPFEYEKVVHMKYDAHGIPVENGQ